MTENAGNVQDAAKKRNYKCCFVPLCNNTTISTPSKIFVSVPKGNNRKIWCKMSRRSDASSISLSTSLFCCEDHFHLQEDIENYMRVRLDPNASVRLRKGALPTIFDCQPDRQRSHTKPTRPGVVKRQKMNILNDILNENLQTATVTDSMECKFAESVTTKSLQIDTNIDDLSTTQYQMTAVETDCSDDVTPKCKDVGIQVKLYVHKKMRSKYVQNVPVMQDASCSTEQKIRQNVFTLSNSTSTTTNVTSSLNNTLDDCDDEYLPSEETSTSEGAVKQNILEQKVLARNMRMTIIQHKPKMYLGIPNNAFFFIQHLSMKTGISIEQICLTITKIKLNASFAIIGDDFGVSASNANAVFRRTLPVIAHFLKQLIVWPSKQSIKLNLPLPFRARYSHVQSIIDCLEIEIQKPSSAINQSVTWSEYKKCNTLKYLISVSPDGTINFISEGFCGRITDATIVELSQYLNELPENCAVMADRGFKNIEHLLQRKGCILIRPPSVLSKSKPTKEEVVETRRIASLRIHVERVIRRIREFNILQPHSTIHHDMIDTVDDMIIVAAGLINIQLPLIAQ